MDALQDYGESSGGEDEACDALASARAALQIAPVNAYVPLGGVSQSEQPAAASASAEVPRALRHKAVVARYAMDSAVFEAQLREEERRRLQQTKAASSASSSAAQRRGHRRRRPGTSEKDAGSGTYVGPWAEPEEEQEQEEEERKEEEEIPAAEEKPQHVEDKEDDKKKDEDKKEEDEEEDEEKKKRKKAKEDPEGAKRIMEMSH